MYCGAPDTNEKRSPCLLSSYTEHIIWKGGLDSANKGMKTGARNVNNLSYANDTGGNQQWLGMMTDEVKEENAKKNNYYYVTYSLICQNVDYNHQKKRKETETWQSSHDGTRKRP